MRVCLSAEGGKNVSWSWLSPLKGWGSLTKVFTDDSDATDIRLPFYRSFSTFWNIFGGFCTQVFYSWSWVKGDVKTSVT